MKILILLLSASLFLSISISNQEPESPELKEATEFDASVVKLFNQAKYDEALPLAKRALQIREKLLPRTDPRVSASLLAYGDLYIAKQDYDAAKPIFERLLPILEERYGPMHVELAATLDRLAVLYHSTGNMRNAENIYQRAVTVREKAFGPENVMLAEPLFSLAQFYRYRKIYDRALLSYKRTLSIYGKTSGVTTAEFERASDGLRCLAYESNNHALFKELEAIRRQLSPTPFPDELPKVMNGKAISMPRPEYPPEARDRALSGAVIVSLEIDETGKVVSASDMCQGPPYLSQAAIRAALKARFSPTTISGIPVKVKGVFQYKFIVN